MLLSGLLGAGYMAAAGGASAQESTFDALLAQLEADPTNLVESTWTRRERQATRSIGQGTPSSRAISRRATDMIVRLEVGSQQRYEARYRSPIWPGGQSGVTIGIGYDLRFANENFLQRDWGTLLSADMINTLKPVLGLGRTEARDALATVQSVDVPWAAAYSQFNAFIPYPTKETEDAFPHCAELTDDSFGALVSLVYNRGASMPINSQRRREMREIRDLMSEKNFAPIPDKIREMKRLWPGPNERGLIIRRELEAVLFELGLPRSAT
jgi:GH24 family phage-related lysozyme (muramidase)